MSEIQFNQFYLEEYALNMKHMIPENFRLLDSAKFNKSLSTTTTYLAMHLGVL